MGRRRRRSRGKRSKIVREPPERYPRLRRRWRTWHQQLLDEAVWPLVIDDKVFRETMQRIERVDWVEPSNSVYQWMIRTYATSLVAGLRRVLDPHPRTISLWQLVRQIRDNHKAITRRAFVSKYGGGIIRAAGHSDFDSLCCKPGAAYLPWRVPAADFRRLEDARRSFVAIPNKQVLHLDPGRRRFKLSKKWSELHDLVQLVAEVHNKYEWVLTGAPRLSPGDPVDETLPDSLDEAFGWPPRCTVGTTPAARET
jgi:hypothetical protein